VTGRVPGTGAALCALVAASVLLLAAAQARAQADYAREQRWAAEVRSGIVVGDAVELELTSGRRFLGILTAAAQPRAGVVVVHGLGVHPDWGLIGTLRSHLPDHGYTTLSVQMPVLAADATADGYPQLFPEAAERLAVAVAFLRGKGLARVAIVSHSMGARMTDYFVAKRAATRIDAWVAIGLSGTFGTAAAVTMPVLDLHGERDSAAVLNSAGERAATLRSSRGSAQVQVAGADHFFAGQEAELVRQVRIFLDYRLR